MSGYLFEIKQNDRLPAFQATLQDDNGTALDLTGCSVKLYMKDEDDVLVLSGAMTIEDAEAGSVKYEWAAVDTQYAGEYQAEIEITYSSGKTLTVPTSGYINITIYQDLGPEA